MANERSMGKLPTILVFLAVAFFSESILRALAFSMPSSSTMAPGPALFLDFDGTVVESEPFILVATNKMLAEVEGIDVQWSAEVYRELLKVGNTEARLTHYFNENSCWPRGVTSSSPVEEQAVLVKSLKEKKDVWFDSLMNKAGKNFQCRPGILRLMEETILELEGTCCIVSNTNTDVVQRQFNRLIENAPDYHYLLDSVRIFGGDLAPSGKRKPHPDLYVYAAEVMGLEPREVVVVEDSCEGLTAALSAGHSDIIITKNFFTEGSTFAGAALVLDELPQDFSLSSYLETFRLSFDVQIL